MSVHSRYNQEIALLRCAFVLVLVSFSGVICTSAMAAEVPVTGAQTIEDAFVNARSVCLGDMDGDGDLDVVGAAQSDADVSWFENTAGDGSSWTEHVINDQLSIPFSLHGGDIDADGDLDLVTGDFDADEILWWENDGFFGDGTGGGEGSSWTPHTVDTAFGQPRSVVLADIDGDGHLDIVAAAALANRVTWWENDGTPGDDVGGGDGNSWTEHTIDAAFLGASSVFTGDIDGDGDTDVVGAAADDNEITWWENDGSPEDDLGGDGNSWTEHLIDGPVDGAMSVVTGDVNGDGNLDGYVNAIDVQLVINATLDLDISPYDVDVDGDGEVKAADIQLVINAILRT